MKQKIKQVLFLIVFMTIIIFFVGIWNSPMEIIEVLCFLGVDYIVAFNIVKFIQDTEEIILIVIGLLSILFGLFLLFRYLLNYYLSRIFQLKAQQLLQNDTRKPILILRPFKKDNLKIFPLKYAGETHIDVESILVSRLNIHAPIIAIGKPNETLQPLGASRLYIDDSWQQKVTLLLEESLLIILMVDFTPGIKWEIESSLNKYKEKLIIIPKLHSLLINNIINLLDAIPHIIIDIILVKPLNFIFNKYWIKHIRRGYFYYNKWKKIFTPYSQSISHIDDTVSAIIFLENQYKTYHSENPKIVNQINSILQAINEKCDSISRNQQSNLNLKLLENTILDNQLNTYMDLNSMSFKQKIRFAWSKTNKRGLLKFIIKLLFIILLIWIISYLL
jgi:hypothetical protein